MAYYVVEASHSIEYAIEAGNEFSNIQAAKDFAINQNKTLGINFNIFEVNLVATTKMVDDDEF